jgi:hypothetical protein
MGVDWDEVNRLVRPSPDYQTLIKRLLEVFSYEFVKSHYNHDIAAAEAYAARLLGGDPRGRYGEWLEILVGTFRHLDRLGVKDCLEFVHRVETRDKLDDFYELSGLALSEIIGVLKYLLNWVLPTRLYLRELVDKDNVQAVEYISILREGGIRFTLDILEKGRTKRGRGEISVATGVPEDFIYEMVNRADFTRLPYTRGSVVRHYFDGGCRSLEKLANTDLATLNEDLTRHFNAIGMSLKRAMELDSGAAIAKILPELVEH